MGNQLARLIGVEIYIVIYYNNKYYTYKLTN